MKAKKSVTNRSAIQTQDHGYVLIAVLVLIALTVIVTTGMLQSAATNAKTRAVVTTQAKYYYEVEDTLNRVLGWLQQNSTSIVAAFRKGDFENNFELGSPSLGDNEGEHFSVPTMVKMKGTNNSVMLSNNSFFGVSAFPTTTDVSTGSSFDAVSAYANADLGSANSRVVLIWARNTDGNYEPVFRVDVVTGNSPDRGVHSYSYVFSTITSTPGSAPAFYGQNFLTLQTGNNICYSYRYTLAGGVWNRGAPRSNCEVASNQQVNISSKVYGSAKSLADPGVNLNAPGGSVSGDICEGAGCHGYTLPVFGNFESYCPVHNGDVTIAANTTWATGGCWRNVAINNNRTLTLTDYQNPYYFKGSSGNRVGV